MPPGSQDAAHTDLLERIAGEPALAQLVAVVFAGVLVVLFLARVGRRVREARERAGTRDFLLGVELALCGDAAGALRRLEPVVREDPGNTAARLLLAEVLTALGRPAEAHREHVALGRAFGSRAPRNDAGLARALLATGRAREAAEAATRAAALHADDLDLLRVRFAAERASDQLAAAADTGARLAARLPEGEERAELRGAAARCAEAAGLTALRAGRRDDARRLLATARRAAGDVHVSVKRLESRIALFESAVHALGAPPRSALPAVVSESSLGVPATASELRLAPLASPGRTLDAIEANHAHVERLCRAGAAGSSEAIAELVELGPAAADACLDHAVARGAADVTFPRVFAAMGPDVVPALLEAWARRRQAGRDGPLGRGRAVAVLGAILRALGPAARDALEPHLVSDDRELRKALVDYHLALVDAEAFAQVFETLPPVEVVQRLNEVPDDLLVPFLEALPEGHVALDVLLPDGGFVRDVAVLEAIPGARAPQALERLLVRRGYARSLVVALVEQLADPRLGPVCDRLLDAFGERALPALVMAFADPDRPEPVRHAVGRRLVAAGGAAVVPLCRCFGASPSPLDSDVMALLVDIGDAAVPSLREAYRNGGLLERLAGPFVRRRTHRREMLVWTLCGIGTLGARTALVALREREGDADLRLRLAQAVHRIDERGARPADDATDTGEGRARHGG